MQGYGSCDAQKAAAARFGGSVTSGAPAQPTAPKDYSEHTTTG